MAFISREWAAHIAADYSLELQDPGQVVGCIAELNAATAEVPLTMQAFRATLDGTAGVTRLLPRYGRFLEGALDIVRKFALHRRVCGPVPAGAEGGEEVGGRVSPTGGSDDASQDRSPPPQRPPAGPPAPAARPRIARKRIFTVDSDD